MKKMVKKIIFVLLIGIIGLMYNPVIAISIANVENIVRPSASDYISAMEVEITAKSNGEIQIQAGLKATQILKKLGFEYIEIQRYENGRWSIVDTISSDLYKYNSSTVYYSSTYRGEIGEIYRVLVKFYAGDNTGSDTRLVFSNIVSARK